MHGIVDRKGEQFAYVENNVVFTMDGEPTGYVQKRAVVDLAGAPVWRIIGDCIYQMGSLEPVGFFTSPRSEPDL